MAPNINNEDPNKLLYAEEAEEAILGCLMSGYDNISDVAIRLGTDRFYSFRNQIIYGAILSLNKRNIKVDLVAVKTELEDKGQLQNPSDIAYVASLTNVNNSSGNLDYYIKVVKDRALRRDLVRVCNEIRQSAFEGGSRDSSQIVDAAEQKIFSVADLNEHSVIYSAKDIMLRDIEIIQQRYRSNAEFTGIPSGFALLDTYTSGFQKSELIIIGARPSIGKTAFALSMINNIACEKRIPCGFFSLEMPYDAIGMRFLSQEARVPMQNIRSGMLRMEDVQKIQEAAARWFEAPLYMVDTPNMRLIELRSMARRMVERYKVQIIFIDYIGLITTEDTSVPVFEQVSEISKSLKALARELDIPIVALSQVARSAEGEEPNLAQLRGSGSIEQDADVVMFLHRERLKEQQPTQVAKLILAKQRNGATGDIEILFLPGYSRFENKLTDHSDQGQKPIQQHQQKSAPQQQNNNTMPQ